MVIEIPTPRVDHESISTPQEQDKHYHCRTCLRSWAKPSELARHEITHSCTKPYPCPKDGCTMSFSQKTALKTHSNTHTGERPHTCEFCGKTFGDPSSRTRHEKELHKPEVGFKCPECDENFKRKEAFRRHHVSKHGRDPTRDRVEEARKYCADDYKRQSGINGDAPITNCKKRPASPLSSSASPPPRKRRNAIASTSGAILDNGSENQALKMPVPQLFSAQPGHKRNESSESGSSYVSDPYYSPTTQGSYTEAFNPAYPLPLAYPGASPAVLQYPVRSSASPGGSPQGGYPAPTPVMARMPSPHYERDITDIALERLANGRIPTVQASVAPAHTISGPMGGHYGISGGGVVPSPRLAMPEPQHTVSIRTGKTAPTGSPWSANRSPSGSPNTRGEWDGATSHPESRVPRSMPRAIHPHSFVSGGESTSPERVLQYSRDNHNGMYGTVQGQQGQPLVVPGSAQFMMLDNTYHYPGSSQAMGSSDSATPPHPDQVYSASPSFYDGENSAMPLSLAGMHGTRHD